MKIRHNTYPSYNSLSDMEDKNIQHSNYICQLKIKIPEIFYKSHYLIDSNCILVFNSKSCVDYSSGINITYVLRFYILNLPQYKYRQKIKRIKIFLLFNLNVHIILNNIFKF